MDDVVNFRPDGSIAFDVDDEHIVWRPPRVKHMRHARNRQFDITNEVRALNDRVRQLSIQATGATDPDEQARLAHEADEAARSQMDVMTSLYAEWVVEVHGMLAIQGLLPPDDEQLGDDWPSWLPTIQFATAVVKHWGTHPFGSSNGAQPSPPVTAP